MPKIIENLESRLIEEAQKQIRQSGYGSLTIRSVAKACGVGDGTAYNYFPAKDDLSATSLLQAWRECVAAIESASRQAETPEPVVRCIHTQLTDFIALHQAVFTDEAAVAGFSGSPSPYHSLLRGQLAKPLRRFCNSDFTSEFIAEALLTWTVAGRSFDEIYTLIEKLL